MTHSIDVSKGTMHGAVSSQWASRPNDQKFLSLATLAEQVERWKDQSQAKTILPAELLATYDQENPEVLALQMGDTSVQLSHWSMEQVSRAAGAPAYYLRSLPGPLAALNINYGLKTSEQKPISAYVRHDGESYLRGITSPKYGRIFDADVVKVIRSFAGDGTGDTQWKVPGCIEWGGAHGITYNPHVSITTDTTTLYASDRDIFIFLVDDTHPIEVGKLKNGDPDLMFRGFYAWNSETGSRTFGCATMMLRGVCQNRNLWGVEGFSETVFKHTSGAPERFLAEAAPQLVAFADGKASPVAEAVAAAKAAIVASTDEERVEFLVKANFSQKASKAIIATGLAEEEKAPESVWDFAQAITATARSLQHQDERIKLERIAGSMLNKVKV